MPTYEYRCTNCEEHLEVVQSFSDEPLTKCPNCGKKTLRKVFSPVGIVFKGSGFYKTDSRAATGGSKGPKKEAAKESSSSTSTSSESKSESSTSNSKDKKTESKSA